MTDDDPFPEPQTAWQQDLTLTETACWTFYHQRNVHWIGIGTRIWASQLLWTPAPERPLPEELLRSAKHEVALRGEFTTRAFGELAARVHDVAPSVVLVECSRRATELLRDGCRDIEADIVRTARFVPEVDVAAWQQARSDAIRRLTDHLLAIRGEVDRPL